MRYEAEKPANPVDITVTPHHTAATLNVTTTDPDAYYRISGIPASYLADYDHDDWVDILVRYDIEFINTVAEDYGAPLSAFKKSDIFEQGNQPKRDWYPSEMIMDNTPIAMVVYTGDVVDDKIVVTSEPRLIEFTTKKLDVLDCEFTIKPDVTSTKLNLTVDASDPSVPFAIELYSEDELAVTPVEDLVKYSIRLYESMIYNYGATWEQLTFTGSGEKKYTNRRMGDRWLAGAVGLEYGVVTTEVASEWITIPAPEIVSDCTFEVTTEQKNASEVILNVTPSDPEMRYAAFFADCDKLGDKAGNMYVADKVYWANYTNQINWESTEYVHKGAAALSTHDDVVDGAYLSADKDYKIFIVGLSEDGTQLTEVKEVPVRTSQSQGAENTFDISFSDFDNSSQWSHFVTVNVTPSDLEENYVVAWLPATNSYADLSYSDEEFINRYVEVEGKYLKVQNGVYSQKQSLTPNYDYDAGGYVFGEYILAVFGYDGGATTGLYAYRFNGETGEAELVRKPEGKKELSFTLTPGQCDIENQWYRNINYTITPSDPTANYVEVFLPVNNAYANLNVTDEEFINNYVEVEGTNLVLRSGVRESMQSISSEYDFVSGGYVFGKHLIALFGYDGGGTSPVYAFEYDSATGVFTQVRGPEGALVIK